MEIKHSAKWKVLTITDKRGYTSTAMTTTKQNNQEQLEIYICRSKVWLLLRHYLTKRWTYFFVIPCGWLTEREKKSLHKRYMCSFSGIITGPPRFSFRFQMRSDMFRLAHLCSESTELLSFHWQILISLNLCTVDDLKNLHIFLFQRPCWIKFLKDVLS